MALMVVTAPVVVPLQLLGASKLASLYVVRAALVRAPHALMLHALRNTLQYLKHVAVALSAQRR